MNVNTSNDGGDYLVSYRRLTKTNIVRERRMNARKLARKRDREEEEEGDAVKKNAEEGDNDNYNVHYRFQIAST